MFSNINRLFAFGSKDTTTTTSSLSSSSIAFPLVLIRYYDRQSIWKDIINKLRKEKQLLPSSIDDSLVQSLLVLTQSTAKASWIDCVPIEWREIYAAIYQESKNFVIPESEINKIKKDVHRTFGLFGRKLPHLHAPLQENESKYYEALTSILLATSHERNYCQGINFLAASCLLLEGNDEHAFVVLNYLQKQCYLEILFNPKCSSLVDYIKLFEKRLRKHNRIVYSYFKEIGYTSVCYAVEWFTTCFIVSNPGSLSCCVIDLILNGMDDVMIRVGLAIMDALEPSIVRSPVDELQENFKTLVGALDPVLVISNALLIPWEGYENALQRMYANLDYMAPDEEHIDTLRSRKPVELGNFNFIESIDESKEQLSIPSNNTKSRNSFNSQVRDRAYNIDPPQVSFENDNLSPIDVESLASAPYVMVPSSRNRQQGGHLESLPPSTITPDEQVAQKRYHARLLMRLKRENEYVIDWLYPSISENISGTRPEISSGDAKDSGTAPAQVPILAPLPFVVPCLSVHAIHDLSDDETGGHLASNITSSFISFSDTTKRNISEGALSMRNPGTETAMQSPVDDNLECSEESLQQSPPVDAMEQQPGSVSPSWNLLRLLVAAPGFLLASSRVPFDAVDGVGSNVAGDDSIHSSASSKPLVTIRYRSEDYFAEKESGADTDNECSNCGSDRALPPYQSVFRNNQKSIGSITTIVHEYFESNHNTISGELSADTPIPAINLGGKGTKKHRSARKKAACELRRRQQLILLGNQQSDQEGEKVKVFSTFQTLSKKKLLQLQDEIMQSSSAVTLAASITQTPHNENNTTFGNKIKSAFVISGRQDSTRMESKAKLLMALADHHKRLQDRSRGDRTGLSNSEMTGRTDNDRSPRADTITLSSSEPNWLVNAVHTTLWLGSFGLVSRSVPGRTQELLELEELAPGDESFRDVSRIIAQRHAPTAGNARR